MVVPTFAKIQRAVGARLVVSLREAEGTSLSLNR